MPLSKFARNVKLIPSITSWTRLEPLPRDASMERSLQAQIRDPLWMLARQWQFGEFQGDDAGSPVQATLGVEARTVTTYRPGADDSATVVLDQKLPVEVHVEREAVTLNLRASVQTGLFFEAQIRNGGIASPASVIAAFRTAFPIVAADPDPMFATIEALRFRALTTGRVTDGEAVYRSAVAIAAGQPPALPMPPEAADAGMPALISDFVTYRASLFNEPSHDSAWQSQKLEYQFGLGSPLTGDDLLLNAPDFPGGRLDWYSFSLDQARPNAVSTANPAQVTPLSFNFLPNHVTFRGMPDPRWWNFEDGVTDFGQLDADHVDLAKMLVMEFALVYGNDWFLIPVPTAIGNLSRVTTLVVTDTFGVRTLIRPSEQTQVNSGETPWSMYKLSDPQSRSDFIMMEPTLGVVEDADALEDVLFLRDDMAAMAWAVEHKLHGEMDSPTDAHEMYLDRLKENPPAPPPLSIPGGPQVYYTLETPVPDNWIPMVPVQTPSGALYLRRGTMVVPTSGGLVDIKARAVVLEPDHPFFVADHIVPRSGVEVSRYFRRTRSIDGSTFVWLARRSGPGKGSGWSGLRYDLVQTMKAKAS